MPLVHVQRSPLENGPVAQSKYRGKLGADLHRLLRPALALARGGRDVGAGRAQLRDRVLGGEGPGDARPGGRQRRGRQASVVGTGLAGPGWPLARLQLCVHGDEAAGYGFLAEDVEPIILKGSGREGSFRWAHELACSWARVWLWLWLRWNPKF